jgi:hypothetical protein
MFGGVHADCRQRIQESAMNTAMISRVLMSLILGTTVLVAGCAKKGPAERAGKQVDRAVGDFKDAVERATK